jgi:hypothetical protein
MVFVSTLGNVLKPFSDDYLREKCQSLYNWILVQFALTSTVIFQHLWLLQFYSGD